mgnify:FL=1
MRISILILAALLLATLLAAPAVADDIVWLKNGDRITGKILKKDGDNLVVKPKFGGEVKIPLKEIRSFNSDRPLEITLTDGREHTGPVEGGADQDVTIREPDDTEFSFADVTRIKDLQDPAVEPDYWTGRIYASLNIEDGNTQKKTYHVDGLVVGRWEHDRLTLEGAYNYGKENGDLTDQDAFGQIKYDYFLTKRFYLLAKSRIKHDKFQDLRYRWSTGPGAGYQWLVKKDSYLFETEGGVNWTREDRDNGERDKGYPSADVTGRGFLMLAEGLRFSGESVWGFSLKSGDTRNFVGRSWIALDVSLIKDLALTAKMIWEYENETPPGIEHNDWQYLIGITWTAF